MNESFKTIYTPKKSLELFTRDLSKDDVLVEESINQTPIFRFCKVEDIYVIHQPGGPYWEKLCPRSWVTPQAVGNKLWNILFSSFCHNLTPVN